MRSRGRKSSSRQSAQPMRAVRLLKSRITGHSNKLSGQAAPPVNEKIYYQQLIRVELSEAYNFTPADISAALCTQIFPAAISGDADLRSSIVFKLERVDVWATATGSSTERPATTLTAYSTYSNNTPQGSVIPIIKEIKDLGSLSDAARVSYTWPLDMVETPLSSKSDSKIASVVFNTPSADVRFHLRWSPIGSVDD